MSKISTNLNLKNSILCENANIFESLILKNIFTIKIAVILITTAVDWTKMLCL